MRGSVSTFNNINKKRNEEYKHYCVGKGCNNEGTNPLTIVYINKTLLFCDNCKQDLIKLGLVEHQKKEEQGIE